MADAADIEARLQAVEAELRLVRDRREILDCIAAHARGCDRHDSELLASAYHEDGVDEHGFAINPGPKYCDWANEQHTRGSIHNLHHITTHSVEIDGDTAHAESYVIGTFLNKDNAKARRCCPMAPSVSAGARKAAMTWASGTSNPRKHATTAT